MNNATTTSPPTVSPVVTGEQMGGGVPPVTEDIPDALPVTEPPPPLASPLLIGGIAIPIISALVVFSLAVRGKL